MNKPRTATIYQQFNYGKEHNQTDILKCLKDSVVSSNKYHAYSTEYNNAIQVISFKQPHANYYPILKNPEIIPISKRLFDHKRIQSSKPKSHSKTQGVFMMTDPVYHPKRPKSRTFLNTSRPKSTMKKDLLRELIFNEPSYDQMTYDESLIFHREIVYLAYIRDKVQEIKCCRNMNQSNEFHRKFNNNSVIMRFQSIILEFKNLTDKTRKPIRLKIPFTLLPLFYDKNFENMKYIFLSIISFNKNYDEIIIDDSALYHLLKTSAEYSYSQLTTQSNDITLSRHHSVYGDYEEACLVTEHTTDTNIAPRIQIKDNEIIQINPNLKSKINVFQYLWITPYCTYCLDIRMPKVTLSFPILKKEITKTVENELILFLLMNNFHNWDFYMVNYLLSLKSFRWILQNNISKTVKSAMNNGQSHPKEKEELMNSMISKTINGVDYYSLSKKRMKSANDKEGEFAFFQTDDLMQNHMLILHSYLVTMYSKKMKSNKEFIFSFNLKQMKQLFAVSHWMGLYSFFHKIVTIDSGNDHIKLNYDIFNHLNINEIPMQDKVIQLLPDMKKEKELNIEINNPYIEKIDFLKELNINSTSIISDTNDAIHRELIPEYLKEICNSDMYKWPMILSTFKKSAYPKTITVQLRKNMQNNKGIRSNNKAGSKRHTMDKNMIVTKPKGNLKASIFQLHKLNPK